MWTKIGKTLFWTKHGRNTNFIIKRTIYLTESQQKKTVGKVLFPTKNSQKKTIFLLNVLLERAMNARLPLLITTRDEFEVSKIIEEYSIFVDAFLDRNGHLRTSNGQIIDSDYQLLKGNQIHKRLN